MLGLSSIENKDLAALRFPDEATFRHATRVVVRLKIPVDAPGRNTLIIRSADIPALKREGIKNYVQDDIPETHKVSDKERAALRRRLL